MNWDLKTLFALIDMPKTKGKPDKSWRVISSWIENEYFLALRKLRGLSKRERFGTSTIEVQLFLFKEKGKISLTLAERPIIKGD